jgi:hypothetical protein
MIGHVSATYNPEPRVPLATAAKLVPSARQAGKGLNSATLKRWAVIGAQLRDGSRIKLDAVYVPGGWTVAIEAVERFIRAVSNDRCGNAATQEAAPTKTRVRELDRVDRQLDSLGV